MRRSEMNETAARANKMKSNDVKIVVNKNGG